MKPENDEPRPQVQLEEPVSRQGLPRPVLLGFPLVVALVVGGMYWHYRNRVSTDDAQVDGHLVPVSAKISGSVERVAVEDNQAVREGDLLVQLDPRDLQARVDQARASLTQTQAQVEGAQADLERARVAFEQARGSDLLGAQAALAARRATQDRAQADLRRMKPLAEREEISALQFDAIRAQAEVAENDWKGAQRRLDSLQQEAEIRKATITAQQSRLSQSRAQVEQARAALAALELQLSYTRINASVAGVVTRKMVETGQTLQPGQGLMTLVPLHQTWVTANFKETQLKEVRPGQEAEVKVDMSGQVLRGRVDSIAGSTGSRMSLLPPENAVGNFVKVVQRIPVKIRLDAAEAERAGLRPGMNVEATILTR
jgi:membrane fusion protein, multidrug efflux system